MLRLTHAGVVPRGDRVTPQHLSAPQQVTEFRVAIAADAGIRRAARGVLADEVLDDIPREVGLHIEDVVGNSQPVCYATGVHDAFESAARLAGAFQLGIAEGLHGDANDAM